MNQQLKVMKMKEASLSIALSVLFLTNQSFVTPSPSNRDASTVSTTKEFVILKAGTPVSFKLSENKTSDELEIGNVILLITDDMVVEEGQPVIRKGERAEGRVNNIRRQKDCRNYADKRQRIEIGVERVKAVDGQYVPLHGALLMVYSKNPKYPVELNTSMRLEAFVESNTPITTR